MNSYDKTSVSVRVFHICYTRMTRIVWLENSGASDTDMCNMCHSQISDSQVLTSTMVTWRKSHSWANKFDGYDSRPHCTEIREYFGGARARKETASVARATTSTVPTAIFVQATWKMVNKESSSHLPSSPSCNAPTSCENETKLLAPYPREDVSSNH